MPEVGLFVLASYVQSVALVAARMTAADPLRNLTAFGGQEFREIASPTAWLHDRPDNLRRSAGEDRASELERVGHVAQRFDRLPSASDCDRAIADEPPHDGLVHVHALNLVQVHLNCTARGFLDTRYCYAAALIGARAANHSRLV